MTTDYIAIGKRIATARKKAGLTQELLAEKAALSPTHISYIECGKTKPSLNAIIAIANVLRTSVNSFLVDNVAMNENRLLHELLAVLNDCSEEESGILIETLIKLKDSMDQYKQTK